MFHTASFLSNYEWGVGPVVEEDTCTTSCGERNWVAVAKYTDTQITNEDFGSALISSM